MSFLEEGESRSDTSQAVNTKEPNFFFFLKNSVITIMRRPPSAKMRNGFKCQRLLYRPVLLYLTFALAAQQKSMSK